MGGQRSSAPPELTGFALRFLSRLGLRAEAATEYGGTARHSLMPAICLPHQVSHFVAAAAIGSEAGGAARTQIPHDAELGLRTGSLWKKNERRPETAEPDGPELACSTVAPFDREKTYSRQVSVGEQRQRKNYGAFNPFFFTRGRQLRAQPGRLWPSGPYLAKRVTKTAPEPDYSSAA